MLNDALELFEIGLSVIPIVQKTKLPPAGCTWKEQQNILPDEKIIEQRFINNPGCNIGIITGKGSGVVVIDGDSAKACAWIEKTLPHTWLTVSNNGRGRHYYYRYPDDNIIKTSSGILYPDVDVRGDKGLIVVPPSIHKSGNKYAWNINEGFSLDDIKDLPTCPVDIPGILGSVAGIRFDDNKNSNEHVSGKLKNIAEQCEWMRHCRADAEEIGYDEWLWMLSIVSRCVDGRGKAHKLSALSSKYNFDNCDKKISETLGKMGAVTCKTISGKFDNCFKCKNLGKGLKFSPVILGAENVIDEKIERITIEDIEKQDIGNLTLQLPEKIINPSNGGDLISMGMNALSESEAPDIPQYSYPVIVSIISRALMGGITYAGVWPNFYMIKVGGTSTGKTDCDKIMRRFICFDDDFKNFYGPDDFSSGPGLLRGMEAQPQCLINLDEISYLFKRFDKHDPVTAGKIEILLQLFTNCGITYKKPYGDVKKSITLDSPCLSIIGNATSGIFDDIRPEDFISGLIQRFTFFCYDGQIPKRRVYADDYNKDMSIFLDAIKKIYQGEKVKKNNNSLLNILAGNGTPIELGISSGARKRLIDFSEHIREAANAENDQGRVGIISRKYYESIKYAMIFLAGKNFELTAAAIDYGIDVANLLGDWKLNVLSGKIREGIFHRDCEVFKEGIAAAIKKGKRPTGKIIADRRTRIKELKPHEFKNVITALSARKEIEIDEFGQSTAYFLLKD